MLVFLFATGLKFIQATDIPTEVINEDFNYPYDVVKSYENNFHNSKIYEGYMNIDDFMYLKNDTYLIDNISALILIENNPYTVGIGLSANSDNYIGLYIYKEDAINVVSVGMNDGVPFNETLTTINAGTVNLSMSVSIDGNVSMYVNNEYVGNGYLSLLPTTFMVGNAIGGDFDEFFGTVYTDISKVDKFTVFSSYKNIVSKTETETVYTTVENTVNSTIYANKTSYINTSVPEIQVPSDINYIAVGGFFGGVSLIYLLSRRN